MTFHSIEFALFLPIVFGLYWGLSKAPLRMQNALVLLASYLFYGWWDWHFLGLIFLSSGVDYLVGLGLGREDNQKKRKWLLGVSLVVNIGLLGFFKYYDFFAQSFADAFLLLGQPIQVKTLNLILPVGISFYTFQTLSYSIDLYRRKIKATDDFIAFMAFVSFFPQLVAGPIERASNLLPQFLKPRKFDYHNAVMGTRQVLWGLFKKVVIGDTCAVYAEHFLKVDELGSGSTVFLGVLFLAMYTYGDFSGYSDMAIGLGRLFGFHLKRNFAYPFFATNIVEFWRRWHMSFMTWLRDYIYIPLGGSKKGSNRAMFNVFLVFLVSALWHGAKWNYVIWGVLNFLYSVPYILRARKTKTRKEAGIGGPLVKLLGMLLTFHLFAVSLVFVYTATAEDGIMVLSRMFSSSFFEWNFQDVLLYGRAYLLYGHLLVIALMLGIEWINREEPFGLVIVPRGRLVRWPMYLLMAVAILFFGRYHAPTEFFYFQF